jgi:hypothetical protein
MMMMTMTMTIEVEVKMKERTYVVLALERGLDHALAVGRAGGGELSVHASLLVVVVPVRDPALLVLCERLQRATHTPTHTPALMSLSCTRVRGNG